MQIIYKHVKVEKAWLVNSFQRLKEKNASLQVNCAESDAEMWATACHRIILKESQEKKEKKKSTSASMQYEENIYFHIYKADVLMSWEEESKS